MIAYLASPYSNPDPDIMEKRFLKTEQALAQMLNSGYIVYSPIVMLHHLAKEYFLPKDHTYWHEFNCQMIQRMGELWVLCIDGWNQSEGIKAEILFAVEKGLHVRYWYMLESGEIGER